MINESKTEEYEIILQCIERWKKCKLLGSLLDTEKDMNRRQIIAIDAFKTLNNFLAALKSATQSKSELSMHMLQVYSSTTANCGLSPKNWKIQSTRSKEDISGKCYAYTGLRKSPTLNCAPKPKQKSGASLYKDDASIGSATA